MTTYDWSVKVQNVTYKKPWENSLEQISKTLLSVIHFKLLLTYRLFFYVSDSPLRVQSKGWHNCQYLAQQAELRTSLRTTPFLLENLKTFSFHNNTQMQSSLLLPLSTLKFVIAISMRTKSHLLNYTVKILLSLLVILCSIL